MREKKGEKRAAHVRTENSLPSVSGRYMNGVDWPTDMGQAGFGGAGAGAWYTVAVHGERAG